MITSIPAEIMKIQFLTRLHSLLQRYPATSNHTSTAIVAVLCFPFPSPHVPQHSSSHPTKRPHLPIEQTQTRLESESHYCTIGPWQQHHCPRSTHFKKSTSLQNLGKLTWLYNSSCCAKDGLEFSGAVRRRQTVMKASIYQETVSNREIRRDINM